MQAKEAETKQQRWALAAGAALLFIIGVCLAVWLLGWSQPNKKDYQQAKTAVAGLQKEYDKLSSALSSYTSNVTISLNSAATAKSKTAYETSVTNLNKTFDKISDMKALRNDDVKTAFDNLSARKDKILSYTNGYAVLRKSFVACSDVFDVITSKGSAKSIAAAHSTAAKDCLPELDTLKQSKTQVFANYGRDFGQAVRDRQTAFDSYADGKQSADKTTSQIEKIGAKLKTIFNITAALQKARDDASAVDLFKKLNQVLDDQIKKA
ncbi:MAG TPA: hypothetical protein PK096_01965 [Candidatus Saccharibacteria bacterium]|nr:hypothetical protein [Candidatus Saccharibacteria bacterium]HRK94113.1 hypothetical protein [Candidatus Saccharibacteria bacterium]